MPQKYSSGRAVTVLWGTLLLILSLLWLSVSYLHRENEAHVLQRAESDARNLSLAFAEHTLASFQRVDYMLEDLRNTWVHSPGDFGDDVKRHQAMLSDIAFQVAVIGADGRLDYSNLARTQERIDLSDREHFRAVRDYSLRGEDRLFVSRPLKGRVSGRWSIQFVRPIVTPSGFAGVLVVSIDPGFFSRFYSAVKIGSAGVVTMVRDSGEVLSRAPESDVALGKVLTGTPYLTPDAPAAGFFRRMAQVDGKERLYGFHRLPTYGVTLVVGFGADEILGELHQQHRLELFGAAAISSVLVLLMFFIARAQAAERRSRAELAESEEKLRKVLDVLPAGVLVVDRSGDIIDSNLSAERILGGTRSDLLSRNLQSPEWEALRPDGTPMPPAEFPGVCALREHASILNVEMGIRQGDVAPRWLMVNAVPMDAEDGPAVIVFNDVSEGKRQQQLLTASEKRFRILFESFTEMVFVVDTSGRFAMVHMPRRDGMASIATIDWIGRELIDAFPGAAGTTLSDILAAVFDDSQPRTIEVELAFTSEPRHYLATVSPLQGDAAWPEGFVLVLRDVTTERATADSLRVAATTFESQEGMMITDERGIILRVNRAFSDLTGYESEEVLGRTPAILKSGRQGDDFYRGMWQTLAKTGYWQGEVWNRRKGGEVFPEWLTISAVTDDEGCTTHYVGAFSDITERKEAEERIRNLAFYDPLTSLPNRRLLLDRLHQALAAGQRAGNYGAILYLDLDHFKVLNDTRGHDAGDELLILMAKRLRAAVREQDTVARLGGDEFVVMLEDLDPVPTSAAGYAGTVAEKLREALQLPFHLRGGDHTLTPSIGVSMFRGHETDVQTLLKQADMALYEAKEQGRNTVRFFSHAMQEAVSAQAAILDGLRRALECSEFELFLQPQFGADGRRTGAEALLRWRPPGNGLIGPDEFIPHAEDSGLIVPIGKWVLERACEVLATWRESRPTECISVNVSARQFRQPDFVDVVAAALSRHGVEGRRLCLELTETAVLGNVGFAVGVMESLSAMGVMISLDDFGTGYSSLSNLKRLPIGEVKIDRSFVQEITRNDQDASIVRAIISMCRDLGMRVVAEGVETEEQRQFLLECRCDLLQGFLLGHPAPIEAPEEKQDVSDGLV